MADFITIKEQIIRGKRFIHIPYGSIENSYRLKYMTEIQDEFVTSNPKALFVVTEKIDGTNCAVQCDGADVTVFKRSGALRFSKKHTPCWFPKQIVALYPHIRVLAFDIHRLCKEHIPDTDIVIIYGEMFGEGIQSGNERYGSGVGYCPFDIVIKNIDGDVNFLTYKKFQEIMELSGWKVYTRPLFIGTFTECIGYNIRFHSTVPEMREITLTDPGPIVEGIVVKPYDRVVFTTKGRMVVKIKNVEFEEVQRRPRWFFRVLPKAHRKASPALKRDWHHVVAMWPKMEPYVTYRRLENVISNIGTGQPRHHYKVNLMDDSLDEFERDNERWKDTLHPDVVLQLKRFVSEYSNEIVMTHAVITELWSDLQSIIVDVAKTMDPMDKDEFLDAVVTKTLTTYTADHPDPKLPDHGIEELKHLVSLMAITTDIYG